MYKRQHFTKAALLHEIEEISVWYDEHEALEQLALDYRVKSLEDVYKRQAERLAAQNQPVRILLQVVLVAVDAVVVARNVHVCLLYTSRCV